VISTERVEELRSEVGEADFAEIVALFIAESDALVAELRLVRDPAAAEALLHALKGSALNLGFDELARLCREGRGAAAGSTEWPGRFAQLLDTYERSKHRLAELA
jgi:HPt (histidine-containing phosphotransfer) domain-containing protein